MMILCVFFLARKVWCNIHGTNVIQGNASSTAKGPTTNLTLTTIQQNHLQDEKETMKDVQNVLETLSARPIGLVSSIHSNHIQLGRFV
jgi:paraquat-inducible protein B